MPASSKERLSGQGWAHHWQWCHLWDNVFRKGEKALCNRRQREEWVCGGWIHEATLQTPSSVQKEGQDLLQVPEQGFPWSTECRLWWGIAHAGAEIHLQPPEDPTSEQLDAQGRLWPLVKPTLQQDPARTCGPMKRGAHGEEGDSVGSSLSEQEGAAEVTHDEGTKNSIFIHLNCWGKEVQKIRSKVKPRKKGGVEGRCFTIWSYQSLSYLDLIAKNLMNFLKLNLFCLCWQLVINLSMSLFRSLSLSLLTFPLSS